MTGAAANERRSAEDMDAPLLTQPQTREPTTPQPTVPSIPPATAGVRRVRARGAAASDPDADDDVEAHNIIIANRAVVANRRNGHRGTMIPLTMVSTSGLPNSSSLLLPSPVLSDMPPSPLDPSPELNASSAPQINASSSPQLNASSAPQPVGVSQPMADGNARFPIMTSTAPAQSPAGGAAARLMPRVSPATGGAAARLPPRSPASGRARTDAGASAASPAGAGASAATTPNQITQRVEATTASIKRKFDEMGEGVDVDNIRELHHLLTKATIQGLRTNEEHAATFNAMEQLMQMQNSNLIKMDILNDKDFNHTALDFVKHLLDRIAELHHNMLMEKDTTVKQAFSTEKFHDLLLESFKIWKGKKIDLQV
jgi:hypothetical protein